MVVARMTDFQDRKDFGRLLMWFSGQKVDINKVNNEQLKEWTTWLNKASQTRKDLRSVGIEPEYNKVLAELFAGIDFGQAAILANTQPDARGLLLRDFTVAYNRVLNEAKKAKQH